MHSCQVRGGHSNLETCPRQAVKDKEQTRFVWTVIGCLSLKIELRRQKGELLLTPNPHPHPPLKAEKNNPSRSFNTPTPYPPQKKSPTPVAYSYSRLRFFVARAHNLTVTYHL